MHVKVASISEWHCRPNTLSFLLYHQLSKPEAEQMKQTYTYVHTYNIPGVRKELSALAQLPRLLELPGVAAFERVLKAGVRKTGVVKLFPSGVEQGCNIGNTSAALGAVFPATVWLLSPPAGPGRGAELAPPTPPAVEKGVSKHKV